MVQMTKLFFEDYECHNCWKGAYYMADRWDTAEQLWPKQTFETGTALILIMQGSEH